MMFGNLWHKTLHIISNLDRNESNIQICGDRYKHTNKKDKSPSVICDRQHSNSFSLIKLFMAGIEILRLLMPFLTIIKTPPPICDDLVKYEHILKLEILMTLISVSFSLCSDNAKISGQTSSKNIFKRSSRDGKC